MKAVQFDQYGDPAKVLSLKICQVPKPGKGEVRIRMLESPVNPSDLMFIRGHYAGVQPCFPSPAGFEGVGIIDILGPQAKGFSTGQRVAVINTKKGGNWAEYTVLSTDDVIAVPDDISNEQVASFFINPASAIMMIRRVLAIPKGEWLLQSAAGSELGRMIIRLTKYYGIHTINIVRRRESVAELKQLGADAVILPMDGPIDEQVRKIRGPEGINYAIDPVVGEIGTQMYQALSNEGRMLVYGSLSGEPIRVGTDPRYILQGHRILEVFWLGYWHHKFDSQMKKELVDEIVALMRKGILLTSASQKYSLNEIEAAVKQAETKGKEGKVLLTL